MQKMYTLAFREDTWILYYGGFRPEMSLELRIKFAYHGNGGQDTPADWNSYQFIAFQDGEPFRVVSIEDWQDQCKAVLENEGEKALEEWSATTNWRTGLLYGSPWGEALSAFHEMVRFWESFLGLGIVIPAVNQSSKWPAY